MVTYGDVAQPMVVMEEKQSIGGVAQCLMQQNYVQHIYHVGAPCGLWGCKNRPAPFPCWMS